MAAPSHGSTGTHTSGVSGTVSFAVPAGVASGDIIVVPIFVDSTATITAMPAGFAHAEGSPVALTNGGAHSLAVVWKRATGADSGTYDFTLSTTVYRAGAAIRYVGCVASGSPWDTPTDSAADTGLSTVTPPVDVTTAGPDRLLVFAGSNWSGGAWTPPTDFTERLDSGDRVHTAADKPQAAAGNSGSVTATCAGTDRRTAWLGALIGTTSSGPATVDLTPAILTLTPQPVTPTPGPVSVALTAAALALSAIAVTPAPGPVSVPLTPATLTLAAVPLGGGSGPVSVSLTPATVALTAVPVTAVPQPVSVSLAPAALTLTAPAVTSIPGPVSVPLTPAALTLEAVAVTLPSGVVIRPNTGTITRPDTGIVIHLLTVVVRLYTGIVSRP